MLAVLNIQCNGSKHSYLHTMNSSYNRKASFNVAAASKLRCQTLLQSQFEKIEHFACLVLCTARRLSGFTCINYRYFQLSVTQMLDTLFLADLGADNIVKQSSKLGTIFLEPQCFLSVSWHESERTAVQFCCFLK